MSADWRTSSIPRVKAAIVDLFNGVTYPGGAEVEVSYGRPRDMQREMLIVGDTSSSEQEWATLGDRQRQEDYDVEILCLVMTPGLSQQEATERCFEIFGAAELALRTSPTLAVFGVSFVHVAVPRLAEGVLEQGYGAVIESAVRVSARI